MRKGMKGFTLIELLIVVAIIGIIAAIAIPNLLNAIDRGKQKRTMADMRSIGTACEEYSIDNNFYPIQTTQADVSGTISTVLEPTYIKITPSTDGWNRAIQFGSLTGGAAYTIRSLGKDGTKNGQAGQTNDFDCDIIFQDGQFTAWPQGIQT
jgi:general secretion pathway protein G